MAGAVVIYASYHCYSSEHKPSIDLVVVADQSGHKAPECAHAFADISRA